MQNVFGLLDLKKVKFGDKDKSGFCKLWNVWKFLLHTYSALFCIWFIKIFVLFSFLFFKYLSDTL